MAAKPELRIAFHHGLAVAQTVERGDDGRGLRHQARGFFHAGFDGVVARLGIVQPQHGNRGAQNVHRRAFRNLAQKLDDLARDRAVADQVRLQRIQFRLLRQAPVPEQIDYLFKGRVVGQGVNVIALVTEDSPISVNETNVRLGGNNSFESRLCDCH